MNTSNTVSVEEVIYIAQAIGKCDFRTTVSRYTTSNHTPWVITVGEAAWHRHLTVLEIMADASGIDAVLAILAPSESGKFGYDIHTDNVDKLIRLEELIADKYIGVKRFLYPPKSSSVNQ